MPGSGLADICASTDKWGLTEASEAIKQGWTKLQPICSVQFYIRPTLIINESRIHAIYSTTFPKELY